MLLRATRASRRQLSETFYRRPLPDHTPALSSKRGRALFREALAAGGLKSYFALAETYETQSEPAFCGITTLSMSLNALGVDPRRRWKGVWRWYTDAMVETHVPLAQFQREGMSFDEFAGVARWNGADARPTRAEAASLPCFRDAVRRACCDDGGGFGAGAGDGDPLADGVLIASYNRSVLGQTGEGHFSPVAGLAPASDHVLVLDTARFKYPPHWVPTDLLWRAMADVNPWNDRSRGYIMLSRADRVADEATCPTQFRAWAPGHASIGKPAKPPAERESCDTCGSDECELPLRQRVAMSLG